jgi:outer membrane receptor protein involved in Fe transport
MQAPCDVTLLGIKTKSTNRATVTFSKALHQVAGLLTAMLLTFAWPGTVHAQSVENVAADAKELGQASLEDLLNMKVYSASRYAQPASQAPASVTIVTHEEIERYGYRTLADLLRSVPGFYVPYDRLYGYVGVRGFANPGDYNTRVLLLVDGHRVNDSVFEQAMVGTEFPVDIDTVERVEVIRGPASSLYGTNAVFGVINVITRTPHDLPGLELSADAASFNGYRGRVSYGGKFVGISTVASATFFDSKGHNRLYFPELNFPEYNNGIATHADADHYTDLLLTLAARGFRFQAVYGDREKHDPTGAWWVIFNDPRNRVRDTHGYLDLQYQHAIGKWQTMTRTYFDQYTENGFYIQEGASGPLVNRDHAHGKQWGAELQVSRTIHQRHKLVGGIEYRNQFHQELANYDVDPPAQNLNVNKPYYVLGAYLQGVFQIGEKVSLTAGVREDYVQRTGSSTNPRFALVYNPWQKTTLKLIYGTAFRSPNTYEMYYEIPGIKANPLVKPERIRAWEVAGQQQLTPNLSLGGSFFYNRMTNFIEYTTDSAGLGGFQNIPAVTSKGVELQVQGKWSNGITARGSYSYQSARGGTLGQWLVGSPLQLAKLNFSAPLWRERLVAGLELQYTGKEKTLAGTNAENHAIANLTLLARRLPHHVEFSASVYNLFNTAYYDPAAQQHPENVLRQDGRNFRIKLTWRPGGE